MVYTEIEWGSAPSDCVLKNHSRQTVRPHNALVRWVKGMLGNEFPVLFENDVARTACLSILLGATLLRSAGWTVVGWSLIAFGILALWLAHQLAIAPYWDEPDEIPDTTRP